MSPTDETLPPMTATELPKSQQLIRKMIAHSVQRRDGEGLDAFSIAVYGLEKELVEAYWELDWARKGIKPARPGRFWIPLLRGLKGCLEGVSLSVMSGGVGVARLAECGYQGWG